MSLNDSFDGPLWPVVRSKAAGPLTANSGRGRFAAHFGRITPNDCCSKPGIYGKELPAVLLPVNATTY